MKKTTYEILREKIEELKKIKETLKESEERFRKAEETLRATNNKHASMIANTGDVIGIMGVDGIMKYKSPNIEKLFGWKPEELVGTDGWETVHPDDKDWLLNEFMAILEKPSSSTNVEYKYKCKDGTYKWIHLAATNCLDDPNIEGVLLNYHDITERRQAEIALLLSEEKFRKAFTASPDSININRLKDGLYLSINRGFTKIMGYNESEVIGKSSVEINIWKNSEDRDRLVQGLRKYGEVENLEAQFRKKDGEIAHGLMSATIIDLESVPCILSITRDITERKIAEKALAKENLLNELLMNTLPHPAMIISRDRKVLTMNKIASKFGVIVGDYCWKEFGKSNYVSERDKKNISLGNTKGIKCSFCRADEALEGKCIENDPEVNSLGKIFDTYWVAIDKNNYLHYAIDITDRKREEEEKIQAQKVAGEQEKMALIGQIAGKMAHDFNNILGIIMGNAEIILLDCKEPETRKTLNLIFEQTLKGKNLTKNLVAFTKDQEPKQEFFIINEKIDLVLNLLKKDLDGIQLRRELDIEIPEIFADPGMMEHALINLIQNSIHALSKVEYPIIKIKTYTKNNSVCFEIEDNGCGIPQKHLNSIYDPAFTLKGSNDTTGSYKNGIKGTGYGMANIKKYVEQHRGSISVESELDSGTKSTICLPIIKKGLTKEEKVEIQEEITHFEKSILLVEDEPSLSNVQYKILTDESLNHKVDKADNGQVAKDLFDRNEYDFISLDYALPGGINGMDVYRHIRKTNQTVPVLFISGNIEFLESINELKQADPLVDHLSKPCPHKDYVMAIEKLLKKKT